MHLFDYVRLKGQFALLEKEHKEAFLCCTAQSIIKLFFQFDNVERGATVVQTLVLDGQKSNSS